MKTKLPQVGICSHCQLNLSQTCGPCPQKMNTIPASFVLFGENNVPALSDLSPRGLGYVTRAVDVFMKEAHPLLPQTPTPQLTDSGSCRDDWDPPRGPGA